MSNKEQKCGSCRYAEKCYSEKTSPRNVVINILACRIWMGIDVNRSTKVLLEMIRPNLIRLVNNAKNRVGDGYIDQESLIDDLESRIIECLLDSEGGYRIGEPAYLTEYLFGMNPRTGWVRKWILWHFQHHQRFYKRNMLYGVNPKSDIDEEIPENDRSAIAIAEENNFNGLDLDKQVIDNLMNIIDDGMTLNANEHRVMTFCLAHANESNKRRHIDGCHTYLSKIMGVSRPRITRLYAVARKKLLHAATERGISL